MEFARGVVQTVMIPSEETSVRGEGKPISPGRGPLHGITGSAVQWTGF